MSRAKKTFVERKRCYMVILIIKIIKVKSNIGKK